MAKTTASKKFRNIYDAVYEKRIATNTTGETLTNQSQAEETDLLTMAKKYGLQSVLPRKEVTEEMYGFDLTEMTDYNQRLEVKERMKQYFYQQPAIIRKEFNDKFEKFYEMYVTDNKDKMYKLGILQKPIQNNQTEQKENVEKQEGVKENGITE